MGGLTGARVVACSFTSSPAVRPRRGDEEDGEVEKDDEERRDNRGLFCGWGSPIDEEADVDDDDEDEDDAISGGKEAISTP